jgi:hypothetical protein
MVFGTVWTGAGKALHDMAGLGFLPGSPWGGTTALRKRAFGLPVSRNVKSATYAVAHACAAQPRG